MEITLAPHRLRLWSHTYFCRFEGALLIIISMGASQMTKKPKEFSSIQPNGTVHIGNQSGAMKNWAAMPADCASLASWTIAP